MSATARILPYEQILAVEHYVRTELDDAERYENRQPLDDSGVWSLHALAAELYAAGFAAGEAAEGERQRGARQRARDAAARVGVTEDGDA